ncbi:hypothetical protein [Sphingobacterium sp. UBA1498]|uniref:hypothetical protein n=1 Tax=Sphingobacterium sp. UBA1498 TaxID=1947481 RepID=UPI002600CDBE|nr:hypothetical protein [Sphingobacterium sp. UBA1498]
MMTYLYIILFIAIVYALYKLFASGKKPADISLQMYYRFQEHPGQYSGRLSSTHGALIFRAERYHDDVLNIVVKDVRSTNQKVEVKLQQLLVLPFKSDQNSSSEVSVRFRIGSGKAGRVDLKDYMVKVHAQVTYQNGEKKAFSTTLPMEGVYAISPSASQNEFKS